MASARPSSLRIWLLPFSILLSAALVVFWISFHFDVQGDLSRIGMIFRPNPQSAADTVNNSADVIAGLLGIAITVVAIVVELAANRYTHRITELFVHEPTNFLVMGYFVVTALQSLLVGLMFDFQVEEASGFTPYVGVAISNGMLAFGLLILLPYFAYVFDFLNPIRIVDRIRASAFKVISRVREAQVDQDQHEAVVGVESLADVALNAMEHKDKGVSMASCDALKQLVLDYQGLRPALPVGWYRVDGDLAHNPDFVSMSEQVLEAVTQRRVWFEMKVLRKYQTLYNEALNKMRDINYLIAINTRHLAEAALEARNEELFDLYLKFFNTYLRATLNARDVRTAYNVLHQYRLLADAALAYDDGRRAIEIAKYFKYYGLLAFNMNLPFILETAAYDLCALNEHAFDVKSAAGPELLKIFLQVDKESESAAQENSLRGVRKAQVKLATHYLVCGDERLARVVWKDMEHEQVARLASIRDEILGVTSREFWEISDRGENFDYLDVPRKRKMLLFFSWFPKLAAPSASLVPPDLREPEPLALDQAAAAGANEGMDLPVSAPDPRSDEVPAAELTQAAGGQGVQPQAQSQPQAKPATAPPEAD